MQNIAKPSIAFHILHHLAGSFFCPPVVYAPYSAVYGVHTFTFATAERFHICSGIVFVYIAACNAGVFVWTDFVQNPKPKATPNGSK